MSNLGRTLILLGGLLLVVGIILTVGPKIPYLGKLPGDIYIQKGRFTFYFPLATCLLLSLGITLVLYLFRR